MSYVITNGKWVDMLSNILASGSKVECRGHKILEILGHKTCIPMTSPLITLANRGLGYRFACAEAAWILSGDNRVSTIQPYSKMIANFSDDRVFFFGAYGPKIMDQLEYIGRALKKDLYSRQAVLTIWREKPPVSNDIPCTISIQFLVRDNERGEPALHLFDNMRSSDTWLGVPYDWFTFSMVGAYFILYFKAFTGIELKLGDLHFTAASQHLYENSFGYTMADVNKCMVNGLYDFTYNPFDVNEFNNTQDLVDHLWSLAREKKPIFRKQWLRELVAYWREQDANK